LNPEHPPLVKLVASAPLLAMPLHVNALKGEYFKAESANRGRELLFENRAVASPDALILRTRMAASLLTVLLALVAFATAREMFGLGPGFVALVLMVFEPTVLAHGAYVTTDVGVSLFFLTTIYAFYRYCKAPSTPRLLVAGVAIGLALASKHSALLLVPILFLLAFAESVRIDANDAAARTRTRRALGLFGAWAGIVVLGVFVLWTFYGWRYQARPSPLQLSPTLAECAEWFRPLVSWGLLQLARWHVLPESYLYGLVDVRVAADYGSSYLFGQVYQHGVWFYFPAVLIIKPTLGSLALVALGFTALLTRRMPLSREVLFLLIPAAAYLAVAMKTPLNLGARHVLPVFALLCVFAAGGVWAWVCRDGRRSNIWAVVLGALLLCHATSSARAFPNYLSYSNEAWGGPSETYRYLTDSAVDWGQQLKATGQYLREHNIHDCWFAYVLNPSVRPGDYGISCHLLPTIRSPSDQRDGVPARINGTVLMSATVLTGFEYGSSVLNPYRSFGSLIPAAKIMDGVFVYQGSFDVPLASALSHIEESQSQLRGKNYEAALAEARVAVSIAPEAVQSLMALGDALAAAGRMAEAREPYERALAPIRTMEPSARAEWQPRVEALLR
jgi:tetratricopeptide (TPR) repeat protein